MAPEEAISFLGHCLFSATDDIQPAARLLLTEQPWREAVHTAGSPPCSASLATGTLNTCLEVAGMERPQTLQNHSRSRRASCKSLVCSEKSQRTLQSERSHKEGSSGYETSLKDMIIEIRTWHGAGEELFCSSQNRGWSVVLVAVPSGHTESYQQQVVRTYMKFKGTTGFSQVGAISTGCFQDPYRTHLRPIGQAGLTQLGRDLE